MNAEHEFLASGYVDGDLTDDERRIAEADPAVMAEVEQLRALRAELADVPPPTTDARESAIAAAMESTFSDLSVRVSPKTLHTRLKARPDYIQVQSARRQFLRAPGAAKWRAQPLLPEERAVLEKWRRSNDK